MIGGVAMDSGVAAMIDRRRGRRKRDDGMAPVLDERITGCDAMRRDGARDVNNYDVIRIGVADWWWW